MQLNKKYKRGSERTQWSSSQLPPHQEQQSSLQFKIKTKYKKLNKNTLTNQTTRFCTGTKKQNTVPVHCSQRA